MDGDVNKSELDWAMNISKIMSYALPEDLNRFYGDVGIDFTERLDHYTYITSNKMPLRMGEISDKFAKLNTRLAKLPSVLGDTLYKSYKSFVKYVVKSSGGFLRFFSVGSEEHKWISLPMLIPFEMSEPEEEA